MRATEGLDPMSYMPWNIVGVHGVIMLPLDPAAIQLAKVIWLNVTDSTHIQ